MDGASRWLRSPQAARATDAFMIAIVFAIGLAGHIAASSNAKVEAATIGPAIVVCALGASLSLWWRRSRPLLVLVIGIGWAALGSAIQPPGLFSIQIGIELIIICFSIGAWNLRRRRGYVLLTLLGLVLLSGASKGGSSLLASSAFVLALVALPTMAGVAARARRQYLEEVERRLSEAERERDERTQRAVTEERTRIARELHDVVAHHVSLIGVQAGAARTAIDRAPERAKIALAAIEASSRDAVIEMRHLLDALRPLTGDNDRAPQPGLHSLPALVTRVRAAGYDIQLEHVSPLDDITNATIGEALSLSVYRVVEEAVTNVTKHSMATTMHVIIRTTPEDIRVDIHDPGPAHCHNSSRPMNPNGRGLLGMIERARLFGGDVQAGPNAAGGYDVFATFARRPA